MISKLPLAGFVFVVAVIAAAITLFYPVFEEQQRLNTDAGTVKTALQHQGFQLQVKRTYGKFNGLRVEGEVATVSEYADVVNIIKSLDLDTNVLVSVRCGNIVYSDQLFTISYLPALNRNEQA